MKDRDRDGDPLADQPGSEAMAYRRARRQVRSLRGWYIHLMVYLGVNTLLWLRYFFLPDTGWHRHVIEGWPWPLNTTLAWGVGLAIHGLVVWSRLSSRGRDWEERKIREFMSRP